MKKIDLDKFQRYREAHWKTVGIEQDLKELICYFEKMPDTQAVVARDFKKLLSIIRRIKKVVDKMDVKV